VNVNRTRGETEALVLKIRHQLAADLRPWVGPPAIV
jgi:hypothetical protein